MQVNPWYSFDRFVYETNYTGKLEEKTLDKFQPTFPLQPQFNRVVAQQNKGSVKLTTLLPIFRSSDVLATGDKIVTKFTLLAHTRASSPLSKLKKKVTLGRSVHSGQFSNLGWELRILGPISWFHFCVSQNPSPSSSTWWTEDLGGSIHY